MSSSAFWEVFASFLTHSSLISRLSATNKWSFVYHLSDFVYLQIRIPSCYTDCERSEPHSLFLTVTYTLYPLFIMPLSPASITAWNPRCRQPHVNNPKYPKFFVTILIQKDTLTSRSRRRTGHGRPGLQSHPRRPQPLDEDLELVQHDAVLVLELLDVLGRLAQDLGLVHPAAGRIAGPAGPLSRRGGASGSGATASTLHRRPFPFAPQPQGLPQRVLLRPLARLDASPQRLELLVYPGPVPLFYGRVGPLAPRRLAAQLLWGLTRPPARRRRGRGALRTRAVVVVPPPLLCVLRRR